MIKIEDYEKDVVEKAKREYENYKAFLNATDSVELEIRARYF